MYENTGENILKFSNVYVCSPSSQVSLHQLGMEMKNKKVFRGAEWIFQGKTKIDGVDCTVHTADFTRAFKESNSSGCVWKAVYHLPCSEQEYALARRRLDMNKIKQEMFFIDPALERSVRKQEKAKTEVDHHGEERSKSLRGSSLLSVGSGK